MSKIGIGIHNYTVARKSPGHCARVGSTPIPGTIEANAGLFFSPPKIS